MIEFARFLAARILEIQAEIDALPAGCVWERNADSLGIDKAYYETGLQVFNEVQEAIAFERVKASKSLSARFERMGCRGGTP